MLKIGDKAPDFISLDQNGKEVKLSDFSGKKVVLYFYPKDNTPGCTAQACDLRDNYETLQKEGYEILGVSCDTEKKHQNFIFLGVERFLIWIKKVSLHAIFSQEKKLINLRFKQQKETQ